MFISSDFSYLDLKIFLNINMKIIDDIKKYIKIRPQWFKILLFVKISFPSINKEKDVNKAPKPEGKNSILPSKISIIIKIIPIAIQTFGINKNKRIAFIYLFLIVSNTVSKEPNTLVISVGNIIVLLLSDLATWLIASTCFFKISKLTADWPSFDIASPCFVIA